MIVRVPRPAARILLLDPAGRILLFRFEPGSRAPFWCTPGGALDPDESYAAAARRELIEETGIDAAPGAEIARRSAEFTSLEGVPVIADERYFLVRTAIIDIDTRRHTPLERRVMRSWRWFPPETLAAEPDPVFPADLAEMIAAFA